MNSSGKTSDLERIVLLVSLNPWKREPLLQLFEDIAEGKVKWRSSADLRDYSKAFEKMGT